MGRKKQLSPIEMMQQRYGKNEKYRCSQCCNFQKVDLQSEEKRCIAYSNDMAWDGQNPACFQMFNRPFRGIRPKILPLYDEMQTTFVERSEENEA